MKKIITAIGNRNLNERLRVENNIQVIGTDIQYKEGIFEILEKDNNIDFLILSEKITDELNIIKLIEKIKLINKDIKIILILENKKEELENNLIEKEIHKIIYHNQIEIKDLIYFINKEENNKENEELKKEIDNLKKLIIENKQINNEKENEQNQIKNKLKKNLSKNYFIQQFKIKNKSQ